MLKYISTLIAILSISSCTSTNTSTNDTIYVSIAPLKYIVEQIADSSIHVAVLVPETTSPESYEPTMQQIKDLSRSQAYISTGLIDFEQALATRIKEIAPNTLYVNLSDGIKVLEGSCSHGNAEHNHGIDPHIWLSPQMLRTMGKKVAKLLTDHNPDFAALYATNLHHYIQSIDTLDQYIKSTLGNLPMRSFAIGHPSLTYFAADYNLKQIAIEVDGKEPSVKAMRQIIDNLRALGITVILFQRQTSDAAAQTIAREIGGSAIEFDPLAQNVIKNLHALTDTLKVILNR